MAPSDTSTFFSSPFAVCVSAKAVYGWFKNGNPQATDAGHETWGKVSAIQAEIGTLINKSVTDSGATWSGAAGDAMRSSTSPLSTWADLTGSNAQNGSAAVAEISSAFRAAQNSVQEPVEVPDKPWYNDYTPWDTDYDDAVEQSQGVDEANMRVINAYADRTNYATSTMPTFEAPADSTAEIDDDGTKSPEESIGELGTNEQFSNNQNSSNSSNNNSVGSQQQVSTFTPPGNGDTTGLTGNTGDGDTNTSGNTDGTTKPSDVNDPNRPPVGTPGRPPVGPPGGIGDPPNGMLPFGPNDPRNPANKPGGINGPGGGGRGGGGGGLGGSGGSRGGLGGGAGTGAGAGGLGAGKGGFGPGGAAAAAGQFGGEAGAGRGGAGGFGPGGAAAAGGRGAAGAGGMGAGGHGAKGEGGDDLEHSSKYLQPSDEYFGDGTMVAPPVIGG